MKRKILFFSLSIIIFMVAGYRFGGSSPLSLIEKSARIKVVKDARIPDQPRTSLRKTFDGLFLEAQNPSKGLSEAAFDQLSDPSHRARLIHILQTTSDEETSRLVRSALLRHPSFHLAGALVGAFQTEHDPQKKLRILECLDQVRTADAVPVFASILNDPQEPLSSPLSRTARRVLSSVGTPYAIETLAKRLTNASDTDLAVLSEAFASVKSTDAILELIHLAEGRRPEYDIPIVRISAVKALANLPSANTKQCIEGLLKDSDPNVASAAQSARAAYGR